MSLLRELTDRRRGWRVRRLVCRPMAVRPAMLALPMPVGRPLLREVSAHGVRAYSLCLACGGHLSASATLCEGCARSRPVRDACPRAGPAQAWRDAGMIVQSKDLRARLRMALARSPATFTASAQWHRTVPAASSPWSA